MKRLRDKVAVITGATSGIGKATALVFAEEGAKLVFCGRRKELGNEIEKEMKEKGLDASFMVCDITDDAQCEELIDKTKELYGSIDILFNNAGHSVPFRLEEIDMMKHYETVFNLNIRSYFKMTSLVLPSMIEKQKGSIINMASLAGIEGLDQYSSYCASKGAVIQFTKAVAVEFANRGIRSNCLLPGLTNTELIPEGCDFEKLILPSVPMKRSAKPYEIAKAALFLASDESSYCTGINLVVDGGKSSW